MKNIKNDLLFKRCLKAMDFLLFLKTAEAIDDLIGSKISDKIIKVSRNSPLNSLETDKSEAENIGFD